jgi:hypothetical protein
MHLLDGTRSNSGTLLFNVGKISTKHFNFCLLWCRISSCWMARVGNTQKGTAAMLLREPKFLQAEAFPQKSIPDRLDGDVVLLYNADI